MTLRIFLGLNLPITISRRCSDYNLKKLWREDSTLHNIQILFSLGPFWTFLWCKYLFMSVYNYSTCLLLPPRTNKVIWIELKYNVCPDGGATGKATSVQSIQLTLWRGEGKPTEWQSEIWFIVLECAEYLGFWYSPSGQVVLGQLDLMVLVLEKHAQGHVRHH